MKIRKLFRLYSCIFLLCAGMAGTIPLTAQEAMERLNHIIPPSPDASAIGKAAEVPVSLYTGIPDVTIPLWTLQGNILSVPISLTYHSNGMKVSEIAGWVGLGWTLHAGGAITRAVRGNPDDLPHGYLHHGRADLKTLKYTIDSLGKWQPPGENMLDRFDFLHLASSGSVDLEPDLFYFNFNGHSGKFILDENGKPVLAAAGNLDIKYYYGPGGILDHWIITDASGTRYLFGTEESNEKSTHLTSNGSPGQWFYSTWHLTSIRSANDEDYFSFAYAPRTVTYRYAVPLKKQGCQSPTWDDLYKYSQTTIVEKHLQRIDYHSGNLLSVLFKTSTSDGFPGGNILSLDEIIVSNPTPGGYDKTFYFDYSFYPATGCHSSQDYLPPCKRLRLDKMTESAGGQTKPPYRFFYDPAPLPPRGSFSQDYWGYYNGKQNESPVPALRIANYHNREDMPPYFRSDSAVNFRWFMQASLNIGSLMENTWKLPGANRLPDSVFMQAGILKKIVYPTGATTILTYEPNRFGYIMYPKRPEKIELIDYSSNQGPSSVKLTIPFDQEVNFIPLFYKTSEEGTVSHDSRIDVVRVNIQPDEASYDTVFSLTYPQTPEFTSNTEGEYRHWLAKGTYRVYAKASGSNIFLICNIFVHEGSPYDKIYKVYSNDYKTTTVQAGMPYFQDDSSYRVVKTLDIGEEDDPWVTVMYYFRSMLHPNQVSSLGLPIPATLVRITNLTENRIIFTKEYTEHDSLDWDKTQGWFRHEKVSLTLKPGQYQIEFYPRIKDEEGFIRLTYDKAVSTHNYVTAGGVRIRQKIDLDHLQDTIGLRKYIYQTKIKGKNRSSGVLMRFPIHYKRLPDLYHLGQELYYASCLPVTVYSNSQVALGSTSGSHIGYTEVTVTEPQNGKTVRYFTSPLDYPDISQPRFPFAPAISFDWKRGLLKQQMVFSEEGTLRQKTEYQYNDFEDTVHYSLLPAVKVVQESPNNVYTNAYAVYGMRTGWNHPVRERSYRYDLAGSHPFITEEKYTYNPHHLQRSAIETVTSDSSKQVTTLAYPEDRPLESPAIDTLILRHMDNVILQQETWLDSLKISGYKTFYGLHNGNILMVVPDSIQVLEGENYRTQTWFDLYDHKARLLQYHKRGDIYHALNWDSFGLLFAKADNARYHASPADYPRQAAVTKYTHDLLYGITSIEDPNGRMIRYAYDPFGRLKEVRDPDHRILKEISYHYRQFRGDTSKPAFTETPSEYSLPADHINAYDSVVSRGCPVTLSVHGGTLGTDAEWHWYTGGCAVLAIGEGTEVIAYPQHTSTYFVRAEGKLNNTPCTSLTLTVREPGFFPDRDTLFLSADGTSNHPLILLTNYTGCDPWQASVEGTGFTIEEENTESIGIRADANPYDTARTGSLILTANTLHYVIPIIQAGQENIPAPELTLTSQPSFITSGTEVTVTATVWHGSSPYVYTWERKDDGASNWTQIKKTPELPSATDQVVTVAGMTNFYIRCTVNTTGYTASTTILLRVVE